MFFNGVFQLSDLVVGIVAKTHFDVVTGFAHHVGTTCAKLMSEANYDVELRHCSDANDQVQQLKDAIEKHPAAIVIGAQDAGALAEPLSLAKAEGIPVIAYDRLIMHTDAISYYASFENNSVGEFQARYVEEKLNLKSGAGPFTIEFIAGSPDDTNAPLFMNISSRTLTKDSSLFLRDRRLSARLKPTVGKKKMPRNA